MRSIQPLKLIAAIAGSFAAGGIGSLATAPNIPTWYADLDKPFFNPPNWLFGPVWSVLYLLMGIALYLVWTAETRRSKAAAYRWFGLQLLLNAAWSLVFFGLHLTWVGLAVILILDLAVVMTIRAFRRLSPRAAWLLWPYLAWILFASGLNLALAVLN